ncbi:MAG: amidophosphoribosyltransferase [Anaerovorax sp.]
MGGLFGVASKHDCVMDLFFGTDYHSHLGTKRGGMVVFGKNGFDRTIHNIENSPFRTKFEKEVNLMAGTMGIGSISDGEPQPLTVFSRQGDYSIGTVGRINNKQQLVDELIKDGCNQFMSMSGGVINNTELVASLISTGVDIVSGIRYAQEKIEGSVTILIMTKDGLYAARDKFGRTPMIIGKKRDAYCAASESFAFINLGYKFVKQLGPAEIVFITPEGVTTVGEPQEEMRICTFLWTYFGYTTSTYEGINVEQMRYRSGASIASHDVGIDVDYVAGVPDSGTAHALGYANKSGIPYSRPLIKYTPTWPRSFMPQNQKARELIARMKLVPVFEIIAKKKFVLIDDSIVRGTQLSETVKYLCENGAKEIHVRSACPPIMYGCKYLNFSRSVNEMDLITRRVINELEGCVEGERVSQEVLDDYVNSSSQRHANMVERIRNMLNFDSLRYHALEDTLETVGLEPCKLCTYCWNGKE